MPKHQLAREDKDQRHGQQVPQKYARGETNGQHTISGLVVASGHHVNSLLSLARRSALVP